MSKQKQSLNITFRNAYWDLEKRKNEQNRSRHSEETAKNVAQAFLPDHFRGHVQNIRKATFARDKATATRSGLHLCHP